LCDPDRMPRKVVPLLFLGCLIAAAQSLVSNPSFETADLTLSAADGPYCNLIPNSTLAAYPLSGSVANWTASSTSTQAGAGADSFPSSALAANWTSKWWDGNNLAWMQINAAGTVSMSQTLSAVLLNNTTYTLSAMVGRRLNGQFVGRFNYALQLWAGSTMLASASNLLTLTPGTSGKDSVSYSSGPSNPQAGQSLIIVLSSTGVDGSETEAHFDEISLTASSVVTVNGVVSASAFGEFPSASPGSWIEIYGTNLADETRGWTTDDFTGVTAPTSLSGTSVTIGGQDAFIDYISPGQVNALIPSSAATGQQQLTLQTSAGTSAAVTLTVNAVQPGLLAPPNFKVGGVQYVVATFADGTYVLPAAAVSGITSQPAKPGDEIVLYGIGFGPVSPSIPAGQLVAEANSLADFQISIGGMPCKVEYDGLAPNYTGLYQINLTVPDVAAGNQPLTFTVGGTAGTQTLYVAVGN